MSAFDTPDKQTELGKETEIPPDNGETVQYIEEPTQRRTIRSCPVASPTTTPSKGKRKKKATTPPAPLLRNAGFTEYEVGKGFPKQFIADKPVWCCCSIEFGSRSHKRRMVNNLDFWCETCLARHLAPAGCTVAASLFRHDCGWRHMGMPKDGDCFFHAIIVALQLTNVFSHGEDITVPTITEMRGWWAEEINEETIVHYIESIRACFSEPDSKVVLPAGMEPIAKVYNKWLMETHMINLFPAPVATDNEESKTRSGKKREQKSRATKITTEDPTTQWNRIPYGDLPVPEGEDFTALHNAVKEVIRRATTSVVYAEEDVVWADTLAIKSVSER